jgi:hypothetical protein
MAPTTTTPSASAQLLVGLVEFRPAGPNHPLSDDSIGAFSKVVARANNETQFREILECYFSNFDLCIVGVEEVEAYDHAANCTDQELMQSMAEGFLEKDGVAFGAMHNFFAEGEA